MRIELKTILCGPLGNAQPGDEITVDDKQGRSLVKGGYAVEVEAEAAEKPVEVEDKEANQEVLETAAKAPAETAVSGERRKNRKPRSGKTDG